MRTQVLLFIAALSLSSASFSAPVKKIYDLQGSTADVELTRKIRDKLMREDGLSLKAQNIDIIAEGANVTLKGRVEKVSETEKIVDLAKHIAPGKNIINELNVQ